MLSRRHKDATLQLEKAAGAVGAHISGVSLTMLTQSNALLAEIRSALLEHEVLFFRDQDLSAGELQECARRFGRLEGHPAYPTVADAPDVQILESTEQKPSKIELWHSDMTFRSSPPAMTLLHAQIVPSFGGDTLWASARAAYAACSQPLKTLLDELTAVHDFRHGFRESLTEPGGLPRLAGAIDDNPPVTHPLVRTHPETAKKVIYVNALFTTHIPGLAKAESAMLLDFLYRHIVTEEFTVRLNWRPNTVAIWDNRSTQHKPVNDYFPQRRKMHRITIAGEVPV